MFNPFSQYYFPSNFEQICSAIKISSLQIFTRHKIENVLAMTFVYEERIIQVPNKDCYKLRKYSSMAFPN